jgi:hypothetical protein
MYNFKKNAKLYIVEVAANGTALKQHSIEIYNDITASQTFDEQGYKRKTLHNLTDMHDYAVVNKANVANFSFTTPLLNITTVPIVLSLAREYSSGNLTSFDIYIQSDNITYKITECVIEAINFNIAMSSIITLSVSGTASKIAKFSGTIPVGTGGVFTPTPVTGPKYAYIDKISATIDSAALDSIASINMDLKNDVSWNGYTTINQAVAGTMMYPDSYVLQGRTLSGSITQFLTSANVDSSVDTSTSSPVIIKLYNTVDPTTTPTLEFNLPSTVFTRRLNFEELINRVYDFRLNSNTTTSTIKYKGA